MTPQLAADGLLRIPDAARFLGVSRSTLYALMDSGALPYVKFGKSRRLRHGELLLLVERHTVRQGLAIRE